MCALAGEMVGSVQVPFTVGQVWLSFLVVLPFVIAFVIVRDRFFKRYGDAMGEALRKLRAQRKQPRDYVCGCSYRPDTGWRTCPHHKIINNERLSK